jgi:phosphate transport system permease protein
MQKKLRRRYARERRFQWYGRISIAIALVFLLFMFVNIFGKGISAFRQTEILLNITSKPASFR